MQVTPPGPAVSCEADDKVPVDPGIKSRKERHQVDGVVKLNMVEKQGPTRSIAIALKSQELARK